jgi:hypothetical protein
MAAHLDAAAPTASKQFPGRSRAFRGQRGISWTGVFMGCVCPGTRSFILRGEGDSWSYEVDHPNRTPEEYDYFQKGRLRGPDRFTPTSTPDAVVK